jgi:hypothetical protein
MFHTKFVGTFMSYLHTKFHTRGCNDLLVIAIKLKAKFRFCTAVTLLFSFYKNMT